MQTRRGLNPTVSVHSIKTSDTIAYEETWEVRFHVIFLSQFQNSTSDIGAIVWILCISNDCRENKKTTQTLPTVFIRTLVKSPVSDGIPNYTYFFVKSHIGVFPFLLFEKNVYKWRKIIILIRKMTTAC